MGNSRLLIAVLAASALSSLITALVLRADTTSVPPSNTSPGEEWSKLNANLENLIRALRPLSAEVANPDDQADTVARTPLAEPLTLQAIAKHLEDLKGIVASQSWQSGSQAAQLTEVGIRHPDAQWPALNDLNQRLKANRDVSSRELFFLTPAVVLQRYGRPTLMSVSNDGSVNWYYDNNQEGDARVFVNLQFVDGYLYAAY